jgi:hypothetical protein
MVSPHRARRVTSKVEILTSRRVPKELIARFVKMCPTCIIRRPSNKESAMEDADDFDGVPDDDCDSPDSPGTRRSSAAGSRHGTIGASTDSSLSMLGITPTFAQQNRWMTDLNTKIKAEDYDSMESPVYSTHPSPGTMSPHYNASLNQQMNALSFPATHNNIGDIPTPSGFPASNVRSTGTWSSINTSYARDYPMKAMHDERIKRETDY